MLKKALFIDFKEGDTPAPYFNRIRRLFRTIKFVQRNDKGIAKELLDTDAIFCKISTRIDKEIFDSAPSLKYVGVQSTAFDAIDAKYARSKKVAVCNLGGYSTEAVAEFAIAVMFEQARELERAKNKARKYDFGFADFMGKDLRGRSLGVIGAGKIGSRIAELGLGIGMKVFYFSRSRNPALEKLGAKKKTIDAILTGCEFITLGLALNKGTEGILNKKRINSIKNGSTLISLTPPKLLNNEAVLKRTDKGEITFIFDHSDDVDLALAKRYLKSKGAVVYPPVAFRTEEANTNRFETFAANIENFVKGKPQNVVN